MRHQDLISEKDQEKLYLIHHMHHYQNGSNAVHELHHCPLFSEKEMKGKKYSIAHLLIDEKLYHILDRKPESVLYDHANNSFPTKTLTFGEKVIHYLIYD